MDRGTAPDTDTLLLGCQSGNGARQVNLLRGKEIEKKTLYLVFVIETINCQLSVLSRASTEGELPEGENRPVFHSLCSLSSPELPAEESRKFGAKLYFRVVNRSELVRITRSRIAIVDELLDSAEGAHRVRSPGLGGAAIVLQESPDGCFVIGNILESLRDREEHGEFIRERLCVCAR